MQAQYKICDQLWVGMGSMAGSAWHLRECASCNTDYTPFQRRNLAVGSARHAALITSMAMVSVLRDTCDCEVVLMALQNNSAMLLQQPDSG